jgi:uncharacterized protein with HEPN domain
MNEKDETRLRDMLDAAHRARKFVEGKTRAALEEDELLLGFAVVRALEIVGEAASKITPTTRAVLPQIKWPDMIGMRNRIVHDYLNVDYDIVWKVVVEDLSDLIAELEKIIPPETD